MAGGETWIDYNGVTLRNVLTRTFRQEAVYDPSDTDLQFFKYIIAGRGYLHDVAMGANGLGAIVENKTVDGTAGEVISQIRQALLQPRGHFRYRLGVNGAGLGGTVLLEADAAGRVRDLTGIDCNNGPKPRRVELSNIVGDNVLAVEFEIEVCLVQCGSDGSADGNESGILSNRWSLVDSIDKNFYTVRTITGRLRTANGNLNPNALRHWVVPRLQQGFRVDSMQFKVTEDALNLEYTVVHREVAFSAPYPATEWRYRHTEKSGDGMKRYADLSVFLAGPRDVDKVALTRIAVAIMEAKLFNLDNAKAGDVNATIDSLELVDEVSDSVNGIHLNCSITRTMDGNDIQIGVITRRFGVPITAADLADAVPGYDSNRSFSGYPGDAVLTHGPIPVAAAWHAFLQSPCSENHAIADADLSEEEEGDDTREDYRLDAVIVSSLPDGGTGYTSKEHREAIYTHWKLQSQYLTDQHVTALPIAGRVQDYPASENRPTQAIVGLALPTWSRLVVIEAERLGDDGPQLPEPSQSYKFGAGTAHLIRRGVSLNNPRRTPDGKVSQYVRADYLYALTVPPSEKSALPIGTNPWEDPAFKARTSSKTLFTGDTP